MKFKSILVSLCLIISLIKSTFAIDKPEVVPRSEWDARPRKGTPTTHVPRFLTIHHSFEPNHAMDLGAQSIRNIQNFHMDTRKWDDIGYHFLIDKRGIIYQGRPETTVGAHTGGHNTDNIGTCLLGNFEGGADTPTDEQLNSLVLLLAWLRITYDMEPELRGHRDWPDQDTDCPGNDLKSMFPDISERYLAYRTSGEVIADIAVKTGISFGVFALIAAFIFVAVPLYKKKEIKSYWFHRKHTIATKNLDTLLYDENGNRLSMGSEAEALQVERDEQIRQHLGDTGYDYRDVEYDPPEVSPTLTSSSPSLGAKKSKGGGSKRKLTRGTNSKGSKGSRKGSKGSRKGSKGSRKGSGSNRSKGTKEATKNALRTIKKKIKEWEYRFEQANGKQPESHHIIGTPIEAIYKEYNTLKARKRRLLASHSKRKPPSPPRKTKSNPSHKNQNNVIPSTSKLLYSNRKLVNCSSSSSSSSNNNTNILPKLTVQANPISEPPSPAINPFANRDKENLPNNTFPLSLAPPPPSIDLTLDSNPTEESSFSFSSVRAGHFMSRSHLRSVIKAKDEKTLEVGSDHLPSLFSLSKKCTSSVNSMFELSKSAPGSPHMLSQDTLDEYLAASTPVLEPKSSSRNLPPPATPISLMSSAQLTPVSPPPPPPLPILERKVSASSSFLQSMTANKFIDTGSTQQQEQEELSLFEASIQEKKEAASKKRKSSSTSTPTTTSSEEPSRKKSKGKAVIIQGEISQNFRKLRLQAPGQRRGYKKSGASGRGGTWSLRNSWNFKSSNNPSKGGSKKDHYYKHSYQQRVELQAPDEIESEASFLPMESLPTTTTTTTTTTTKSTNSSKSSSSSSRKKKGSKKNVIEPVPKPMNQDQGWTKEELEKILQDKFGLEAFRPGQYEAISRMLSNESTLYIAPTGQGKSLVYQFVAYLKPGFVLVISPLISLMDDQLEHLPSFLPGAVLSVKQTQNENTATYARLRDGQLKLLFVSPERIATDAFASFCARPEIRSQLTCATIDEAHCLSAWSHNFRPSYLRLFSLLSLKYSSINCILSLTATATLPVQKSILAAMKTNQDALICHSLPRSNISVSASRDNDKYTALVRYLQSPVFDESSSIIIYATFKSTTESLTAYLQTKRFNVAAYHGGMSSTQRTRTQKKFMTGKLQIIVATVAFGMGIDKADVRGVIHFDLPQSVENYIQEIGRAGRDGKPSFAHCFLDEADFFRLDSLAHSDGLDYASIYKLLLSLLNQQPRTKRVLRLVSMDSLEREFDVKKAVIETLLTYLENEGEGEGEGEGEEGEESSNSIELLPPAWSEGVISFYKTKPEDLARRSPIIRFILNHETTLGPDPRHGHYTFSTEAVANAFTWSWDELRTALWQLQSVGEIRVSFQVKAFSFYLHMSAEAHKKSQQGTVGDKDFQIVMEPEQIAQLAASLHARVRFLEETKVKKVRQVWSALGLIAQPTLTPILIEMRESKTDELLGEARQKFTKFLSDYFQVSNPTTAPETDLSTNSATDPTKTTPSTTTTTTTTTMTKSKSLIPIASEVNAFLMQQTSSCFNEPKKMKTLLNSFSGRIIARILHGVSSPAYPSHLWSRNPHWGKLYERDFDEVVQAATQCLSTFKKTNI